MCGERGEDGTEQRSEFEIKTKIGKGIARSEEGAVVPGHQARM